MIIEIALGIVLAVIILYFLPLILAAGMVLIGLVVVALCIGLIVFFVLSLDISEQDVEATLSFVLPLALLPVMIGIVVTRIPWMRNHLGEPEPLGWNGRLLGEYLVAIFKAYWVIGAVVGALLSIFFGLIAVMLCEVKLLPIAISIC